MTNMFKNLEKEILKVENNIYVEEFSIRTAIDDSYDWEEEVEVEIDNIEIRIDVEDDGAKFLVVNFEVICEYDDIRREAEEDASENVAKIARAMRRDGLIDDYEINW